MFGFGVAALVIFIAFSPSCHLIFFKLFEILSFELVRTVPSLAAFSLLTVDDVP